MKKPGPENASLYKETKAILNKNGIILNRNLGQNYLIDYNKLSQIIKFAKLNQNDVVLEIGPGIGTLTLELAKKAKKVIAIEKDKRIFDILTDRLKNKGIDNVELILADAVKYDFPFFNKIVSNLPYQISSPITFKFLEYDFDLAILMYQKEFAERMNGKVGEKNYSRLSAMLYFKAKVETLSNLPPQSFIPKPKVNSSVIKLVPTNVLTEFNDEFLNKSKINLLSRELSDKKEINYESLCRCLFQHKNKKIRNSLINSHHEIGLKNKKEASTLVKLVEEDETNEFYVDVNKRVIKTTPEEILMLSYLLNEYHDNTKKYYKKYYGNY